MHCRRSDVFTLQPDPKPNLMPDKSQSAPIWAPKSPARQMKSAALGLQWAISVGSGNRSGRDLGLVGFSRGPGYPERLASFDSDSSLIDALRDYPHDSLSVFEARVA